MFVPVAQLDRVFGYEPKGQGFESLQARQKRSSKRGTLFLFSLHTLFDAKKSLFTLLDRH